MNSLWNKNITNFTQRFPQLAQKIETKICENLEFFTSKNQMPNALDKSFSPAIPLHSKYNPQKEAENALQNFCVQKNKAAVYFSFGLGFGPIEFCKKFPSSTLILIENNPEYFFSALKILDWEIVFKHKNLIILLGDCAQEASQILLNFANFNAENLQNEKNFFDSFFSELCIIKNENQAKHQEKFLEKIKEFLVQQKEKNQINTNTLEKFSYLWAKNSCRNLIWLKNADGVKKYFNLAEKLPFVILAAGPSLQKILPFLSEIKKRAIIVCVDTALKAVLQTKIEPDFIVIVDPQYYCALHLEFLESPSSVLIAESAVWPSVFRFNCKEKVLCSSLFPVGQYFEKRLGSKGKLAAGGSVSTTAWDFARKCGSKEIFLAGMDLGFPDFQTHIKGAQFEEMAHRVSTKFSSAEKMNAESLITSAPEWKTDYNGNALLTDKKMSLFAWWFEDAAKEALKQGIKTFSLTGESLAISGIEKFDLEKFLLKPNIEKEKEIFFKQSKNFSEKTKTDGENYDKTVACENPGENFNKKISVNENEKFQQVYNEFIQNLLFLKTQAEKAINLCNKTINKPENFVINNQELSKIDKIILNSQTKDVASLVFPAQNKLQKISTSLPKDSFLKSIYYSKMIYTELLKSTNLFLDISKNQNF